MKRLLSLFIILNTISMMAQTKMNISVGNKTFVATLLDNETAKEFVNRLPLTLDMRDVNSNEKYCELSSDFPGITQVAGTIHAGNLKIWSGKGVVLFYKSFSSPYSYYDLGSIDDATGLAEAVGSGAVSVTFSIATTGIKNQEAAVRLHDIYNLEGKRVAHGTTMAEAKEVLAKGIYLCNGENFIIK